MNQAISEDDLHAFADGRIDTARLVQVEAWLAAHPERRAQVDAWREQSACLHRAYDRVLDEAIPARLIPAMNAPRWLDPRKVAAVAWLLLGGASGYFLRGAPSPFPTPAPTAASKA